MTKAVVIGCREIIDNYCIGCERCLTAARDGLGSFGKYEHVDIVGIVSCGGCPGNVTAKLKLFNKWIEGYDDYSVVFLGNCLQAPNACPLDPAEVAKGIRERFGKEVVVGSHPW